MKTITQFLNHQLQLHRNNLPAYLLLLLAILVSVACLISSSLHYTGKAYGNPVTWISWLLSMICFLTAFIVLKPELTVTKYTTVDQKPSYRSEVIILAILSAFFFVTHLWNFQTAPWNGNGLFDDAAWNIYEAKKFIFSTEPFQAAFWRVGSSSAKGIVFHYYIMTIFKIFGYNLIVFNMAVLFLGFITWFFTVKLVYRLFNNHFIAIISALILNFLPLHFIHSFVGQRYAVAPPLLMASLFFLHTGFKNKSFPRIRFSSILAGLCAAGAIMGKHYVFGLIASLPLATLFRKKYWTKTNLNLILSFSLGFIITCVPILTYIYYTPAYYTLEGNYLKQFFETVRTQGLNQYIDRCWLCFTGYIWHKWFLPDFPLIPFSYYIFLIPGIAWALIKKQFIYLTICAVSFGAAFVAGFSDYRILMVSPLWIVLMAFGLNYIIEKTKSLSKIFIKVFIYVIIIAITGAGLFPCITYLNRLSKNPYSVRYFAQKDVAVSRFLRDIVAGVPEPRSTFRPQDFQKLSGLKEPDYDTLICIEYGYAVPHTFLYDYGAEKILSFEDDIPFNLVTTEELLNYNKNAIAAYHSVNHKDLKLIWEKTPKSELIINQFRKLKFLGHDEILSSSHAGVDFSFYILTIENKNLGLFKEKASQINIWE